MNNEIKKVINWTSNYFEKAYIQKAIVGISGGIDSAVTAKICVEALGNKNVIGVLLPIYSNPKDMIDAAIICDHLGIDVEYQNLSEEYDLLYYNFIKQRTADKKLSIINKEPLINGNAKARLRMITLYLFSSLYNGLVVGTTNKTEAILGYATKYGDGGVDIEPLMEFYKTEIFQMAKILNIPSSIINKAPSAGLWEGQTDEEELGTTYENIDKYLMNRNKKDYKVEDKHTETLVTKAEKANAHKNINLPCYERE